MSQGFEEKDPYRFPGGQDNQVLRSVNVLEHIC